MNIDLTDYKLNINVIKCNGRFQWNLLLSSLAL